MESKNEKGYHLHSPKNRVFHLVSYTFGVAAREEKEDTSLLLICLMQNKQVFYFVGEHAKKHVSLISSLPQRV